MPSINILNKNSVIQLLISVLWYNCSKVVRIIIKSVIKPGIYWLIKKSRIARA